jgi:hypothetical protein
MRSASGPSVSLCLELPSKHALRRVGIMRPDILVAGGIGRAAWRHRACGLGSPSVLCLTLVGGRSTFGAVEEGWAG